MLIHENLPAEFYERILKSSSTTSRVLLIVSLDIDALCACRILTTLFTCDNIQSTIIPVSKNDDLYQAYHNHREEHQHVIFFNCGGDIELQSFLLEDDDDDLESHETEIFVLDSQRPIELLNIYTEKPVHVILKQEDDVSLDLEFMTELTLLGEFF